MSFGQGKHKSASEALEPDGQNEHSDSEAAPTGGKYFPPEQAIHVAFMAALERHSVQNMIDVASQIIQNFPLSHAVQLVNP